jgi:acyl-CoA thioesterase
MRLEKKPSLLEPKCLVTLTLTSAAYVLNLTPLFHHSAASKNILHLASLRLLAHFHQLHSVDKMRAVSLRPWSNLAR